MNSFSEFQTELEVIFLSILITPDSKAKLRKLKFVAQICKWHTNLKKKCVKKMISEFIFTYHRVQNHQLLLKAAYSHLTSLPKIDRYCMITRNETITD